MEPKYVEAIKAGIIGGVILAVLLFISQLLTLLNIVKIDNYTYGATPQITGAMTLAVIFGCGICILYIVVLAATGAIAVRLTGGLLRDLNDAVVISALAGAVAGIIWGIVGMILSILASVINKDAGGMATEFCGAICCIPVQIIIAAVIAFIGGAIYYELAGKKQVV